MNNVWIFQANPAKYRISNSLSTERTENWNLNQHANEIKKGDIALIWISGPTAGIYVKGRVKSDPIIQADSATGVAYWVNKRNGLIKKPRVEVVYEEKFLDRPLLKVFLQNDPDLYSLSILRNPRGTNFRVTESEWQAIQYWIKI